jgi:hypothetical protein
MRQARIRAFSRGETLGRAGRGRKEDAFVKFFLDKRDGGGYSPRFISERPAPRG